MKLLVKILKSKCPDEKWKKFEKWESEIVREWESEKVREWEKWESEKVRKWESEWESEKLKYEC